MEKILNKMTQFIRFVEKAWFGMAIMLLVFGTSCDSLLDVEADGNISGEVYESEANIKAALYGAYYSLGGIYDGADGGELFGGDFKLIPALFVAQNASEVAWDKARAPLYSDFIDNNVVNTNVRIESNWRRSYEVQNVLNNILKNIDNVTTDKDKIQGEALAMRGMLYFEMIRLWGAEYDNSTINTAAIPLLNEPITEVEQITTPTLATVGAFYTQIEADLTQASTLLLPLGKNGTNISYYTCQAYLMRVAMHKDDYAKAETHADNILDAGIFELVATPVDAFNNFNNSSEDIFAIQQTLSDNTGDVTSGTGLANYYASLNGVGIGAFRVLAGSLITKQASLPNGPKFSAVDLRGVRDLNSDINYTADDVTTAFYRHITSTSLYSPSKFMSADRVIPVVRLAEIYLSRAESIYQQTNTVDADAIADLNMIRKRANIPEVQVSDFGSAAALLDSIKLEKKREFLYEGLVFHDLKRWNDGIGNPATPATDPKFILPIPQAETDTWK